MRLAILLACLIALPGCGAAALLHNFAPPTHRAVYELPDRRTLVLVDDPLSKLGDPALPNALAARVERNLKSEMVIDKAGFVPLIELNQLQSRLGADYEKVSAELIGKELGAEQVIAVHIEDASWQPEAGLWRPTGRARVKVIDVGRGERVFPATGINIEGAGGRNRGNVVTQLQPRASASVEPSELPAMRAVLADRLGRDVARLFHDWQENREPGAPFED